MLRLAQRLMAEEARAGSGTPGRARPAFPACDRLRQSLTVLAGREGYRVLLARALVLAQAEAPWLGQLGLEADGTLGVSPDLEGTLAPGERARGEVVLLARLLDLLVTLIGRPLALRLLQDIWPGLAPGDIELPGSKS